MAKSVDSTIWDVDLVADLGGQRHAWIARGILPGRLIDVCKELAHKLVDTAHAIGLKAMPEHRYQRRDHRSESPFWYTFDPFAPAEEPVTQTHPCA